MHKTINHRLLAFTYWSLLMLGFLTTARVEAGPIVTLYEGRDCPPPYTYVWINGGQAGYNGNGTATVLYADGTSQIVPYRCPIDDFGPLTEFLGDIAIRKVESVTEVTYGDNVIGGYTVYNLDDLTVVSTRRFDSPGVIGGFTLPATATPIEKNLGIALFDITGRLKGFSGFRRSTGGVEVRGFIGMITTDSENSSNNTRTTVASVGGTELRGITQKVDNSIIFATGVQCPSRTDWVAGRDLAINESIVAKEAINPNPTVPAWSYGYRSTLATKALTFFTPAQHTNNAANYPGVEGFIVNTTDLVPGYHHRPFCL